MSTTDQPPSEEQESVIRPFAEFLVQQANGRTHAELTDAFHGLIASVRETGKAGRLTLAIDVKPLSKGDDHTLTVTDSVAVKLPKGERPQSVFFIDGDGNLSRTDPRQMSLPLREVADRRDGQQLKEAGQ